jgi:signal transduction histidine kinase
MQAASFGGKAAPASQNAARRRHPRAERAIRTAATAVLAGGGIAAPASQNAARPRHPRVERAIWAAAMAVLAGSVIVGETSSGPAPYLVLDIVVGAVSVALVPLLVRWPVPVALLLSVLCTVSPAATPAATMAALLIACWRLLPQTLVVAGTGIAAHLIRGAWRPEGLPYGWWAVVVCAGYAALVGWGTLVRANQALIFSLRERAEHAEAEQARRVTEARAAERTRMAREMHDVLAHRLSLLATYAGALAYRPDAPPEQLSRAAEVVRSGAHQALDELREVIGVLRDDGLPDLTAGSRPLPGINELPQLIEESRAAGMRVKVSGGVPDTADVADAADLADSPGLPDAPGFPAASGVPDLLGRTVYRVVQEGLTNVRKHAPGELARVTLGGGPGAGADVSVVSRLPAAPMTVPAVPGTGTGLIGLTERVELAGGRLEYGARAGEFRLHAWLPWPE